MLNCSFNFMITWRDNHNKSMKHLALNPQKNLVYFMTLHDLYYILIKYNGDVHKGHAQFPAPLLFNHWYIITS